VHSLTKKSERLCLHNYLILKAGLAKESNTDSVNTTHEVDRQSTVENVIKCITNNFPTATSDSTAFLKKNKMFVDDLCKLKDISSKLNKYLDKQCPICTRQLVTWPHKTKDSYLITLGEVKKIKIGAQFCTTCKLLSYYNLYGVGFVPVHNKVRIFQIRPEFCVRRKLSCFFSLK
jgi:hypothetical protein